MQKRRLGTQLAETMGWGQPCGDRLGIGTGTTGIVGGGDKILSACTSHHSAPSDLVLVLLLCFDKPQLYINKSLKVTCNCNLPDTVNVSVFPSICHELVTALKT